MRNITRRISNAVWQDILGTGLVGGMRRKVLRFIYMNGPTTISQALAGIPHKRDSTINARFSELVDMDLIEIVDTIPDPEGTHEVSLYYLTGRMPVKLEKDNGQFCLRLENYGVSVVFDSTRNVQLWKDFLEAELEKKPKFEEMRVRLKEVKVKAPSKTKAEPQETTNDEKVIRFRATG